MSDVHPFREWRKKKKKTLAEIGAEVGVEPSYISDIERRKKQPSLTVAAKLSAMARLPIGVFVLENEAA